MLLSPGNVLHTRYRIVGMLGQGGYAAVYCAHDRTFDRMVAIKQLRPDPFASDRALAEARKQFKDEAQILATLDHPNLPRVTDFFESEGFEYLVMDYVEGQTLSDLTAQHGNGLDEGKVLDLADQLLAALEYIHRHGIIHRDVKPSNIRLTPDGRVFLVDFGLVKLFDPRNPKTATIMHGLGTPEYAPPEQYDAHQGHTDPRSDVYALGATMYHLLTGRAPATATQRVADPSSFRPPRALGAHVAGDVERAILRAMELQPARRFDSATTMRAALRQARQHVTVSDASLTRRLPSWSAPLSRMGWRRIAAPVGAIALLFVVGVIGLSAGGGLPGLAPAGGTTVSPTGTLASPSPVVAFPTAPGATASPTRTLPPSPTQFNTPTLRTTSTLTATQTATPTRTRTRTPTRTPTPSPTFTSGPLQSSSTPSPTRTRVPTDTPTRTLEPTRTPSPTIFIPPTETSTNTPVPTDTNTPVPTDTNTPAPADTSTPGT